jgi:type III secretory pathway component EscS
MRPLIALVLGLLASLVVAMTQLPDEKEIRERVLSPSVQVALFEGLGGATAEMASSGVGHSL